MLLKRSMTLSGEKTHDKVACIVINLHLQKCYYLCRYRNRTALSSPCLSLDSRNMSDFYFLHCFSIFSKKNFFFLFKFYLFILFMAVLGLCFCARAFSSCSKWGPLFIAVRGPLAVAASPVAEHRLQTCRLSNCGSRAQLFCGMWDLPRPGLEPVSPALAGRFSTTAPPGKPSKNFL